MPIYEWHCTNCGTEKETLQSMNDPAPLCPKCCYNPDRQGKHERMKKKISKSGFKLKGGGWFKDGYSKPQKGAG
jgi:putative FmdB family regulatory protein|tara:strand:+ start:284 stop:505 length:222 start_codon:yes stop_codon:yes gene_type:complete